MIRQLVVLDAHADNTEGGGGGGGERVMLPMHEHRILPAGRRGMLPNMTYSSWSSPCTLVVAFCKARDDNEMLRLWYTH
jgi:hypothetical protein